MTIDVPRSVVAALWVAALGREPDGAGRLPLAVAAIVGDDEPHVTDAGAPLAVLLSAAIGAPVMAPLPAPGEPFVLGGETGVAAIEAGECLVIGAVAGAAADSGLVAVPEVTEFGTELEPGAMVTWRQFAPPSRLPVIDSPAEARAMLAEALTVAVDALTSMDVARWREDAAEEIAQLASGHVPGSLLVRLPDDLEPRRIDLLVRAARLAAIVDLARADDGAAVNAWQADQRAAALKHVDMASRRAMAAASAYGPGGR